MPLCSTFLEQKLIIHLIYSVYVLEKYLRNLCRVLGTLHITSDKCGPMYLAET